jgi:formylglycine-generating enzyme required for sulfatase activity
MKQCAIALACIALGLTTGASLPAPAADLKAGMTGITGGDFWMGDTLYDDAQPVHRVRVHDFWIDVTEVTNVQFARFVAATGYRTVAERPLDPRDFPGVAAAKLVPSSAVFAATATVVSLDDPLRWWRLVPGADWQHPEGPTSTISHRMDHPVVHIAYEDALAYARWLGKRLPTEAEWEYAARGGLDRNSFVWGNEYRPRERYLANTYQGHFPDRNTAADGYRATSPVRAFPANGYGLYGTAGNVWEWVADWYRPDYYAALVQRGLISIDPQGPPGGADPSEPGTSKRVQKGGSFLCTDDYCGRFRPGARGQGDAASTGNHTGFRLAADCDPPGMPCVSH